MLKMFFYVMDICYEIINKNFFLLYRHIRLITYDLNTVEFVVKVNVFFLFMIVINRYTIIIYH